MADRVTQAEVEAILDGDPSISDLSPFITAANLTVTNKLGSNTDINDDQRKEVERWLAAHFAAMTMEQYRRSNEKIGEASMTSMGVTGKALDFTPYGQMVKALDTTGTLAKLGQTPALIQHINPS